MLLTSCYTLVAMATNKDRWSSLKQKKPECCSRIVFYYFQISEDQLLPTNQPTIRSKNSCFHIFRLVIFLNSKA